MGSPVDSQGSWDPAVGSPGGRGSGGEGSQRTCSPGSLTGSSADRPVLAAEGSAPASGPLHSSLRSFLDSRCPRLPLLCWELR